MSGGTRPVLPLELSDNTTISWVTSPSQLGWGHRYAATKKTELWKWEQHPEQPSDCRNKANKQPTTRINQG